MLKDLNPKIQSKIPRAKKRANREEEEEKQDVQARRHVLKADVDSSGHAGP